MSQGYGREEKRVGKDSKTALLNFHPGVTPILFFVIS